MLELELQWLDASAPLDLLELARVSGMSTAELSELVDYGALSPLEADQQAPCFPAQYLVPLRTASQLRQVYDLDLFAVSLLIGYLQRIDSLETELRSLRARQA